MPSDLDVEVRFLDRITRAQLPISPDLVTSCSFSQVAEGGNEQATFSLALGLDMTSVPLASIAEIYAHPEGKQENAPRWRGIVGETDPRLLTTETHQISAYGLMEDMDNVLWESNIVNPEGADLSVYAQAVLDFYLLKRPELAPHVSTRIEPVGVTRVEVASTGSVKSAFSALSNAAPDLIIWGWTIDEITGKDVFVFAPKTSVVGWERAVGEHVQSLDRPKKLSSVTNIATFRGAQSEYPNLLTKACEDNTGFEKITVLGANGNLLRGGGIEEELNTWQFSGGPTAETNGLRGLSHSGKFFLVLDNFGGGNEAVWRTEVNNSVVAGKTYRLECWFKRYKGSGDTSGRLIFQWANAAGAFVGPAQTITMAPPSINWIRAYKDVGQPPAGATRFYVRAEATTSANASLTQVPDFPIGAAPGMPEASEDHGFAIDDIALFDVQATAPIGWTTTSIGGARVINFESVGAGGVDGRRCLHIKADSVGGEINLWTKSGDTAPSRFATTPNAMLTSRIRICLAPGATVDNNFNIELNSGGFDSRGRYQLFVPAGTLLPYPNYQTFSLSGQIEQKVSDASYKLILNDAVDLYVDQVQVRDSAAGYSPDGWELTATETGAPYIPGETFEYRVRAADICPSGSPEANSENLYGARERIVEVEDMRAWNAESEVYACQWFKGNAVLSSPTKLVLDKEQERIDPLAGKVVRRLGLSLSEPDEYPLRVTYAQVSRALTASIELGATRPTLAQRLAQKDAKIASSGGSTSVSGGSVGGVVGEHTHDHDDISDWDQATSDAIDTNIVAGAGITKTRDPLTGIMTLEGTSAAASIHNEAKYTTAGGGTNININFPSDGQTIFNRLHGNTSTTDMRISSGAISFSENITGQFYDVGINETVGEIALFNDTGNTITVSGIGNVTIRRGSFTVADGGFFRLAVIREGTITPGGTITTTGYTLFRVG
jgi:hypothetical protein